MVDAASPPGAASSSFPAAGGQSATLVGEIGASETTGDGRAVNGTGEHAEMESDDDMAA